MQSIISDRTSDIFLLQYLYLKLPVRRYLGYEYIHNEYIAITQYAARHLCQAPP